MSAAALFLHVALTWLLVISAGWALAPARVHALPKLLRYLAFHVGGSVALAALGAAVVAFDLGVGGAHGVWWCGLGLVSWVRWRRGDFAALHLDPLPLRAAALFVAPLVLACAFGAHSLSVVHQDTYGDTPDWMQISKRSYRLLDGDLQYRVADAFLHDEPVEKHFLDDGLVWSAGDRPMAMATIYTGLARLLGNQNLALYRLIVIFFASAVLVAILALLQFVLGLSPPRALLVTSATALHPFVYANIEYTWPKMTGVAFALAGFVLLVRSLRQTKAARPDAVFWCGATGLALAPLCHGTLLFGVIGLLVLAVWLGGGNELDLRARSLRVAFAALPVIALLGIQSAYDGAQTRSTRLGLRIALCSEGSAVYPTPPVSLAQACGRYWERKGFRGLIEDRVANLERWLLLGADAWTRPYRQAPSGVHALRVYHEQTLQVPLYSAGLASPLVALLCLLALVHPRWRARLGEETPVVACIAMGWVTTLAFALVMSETSEFTSRGVPFTQPVLLFVATGALLVRTAPPLGQALLLGHAALGLWLLASDEALFSFLPDPALLATAALAFALGLAALQFGSGPRLERT